MSGGMNNQRPGIGNAASFQVSGWPWITSSHITASVAYKKVELPSVAKSVTIKNVDANQVWPFVLTGSTELLVFFGPDLTGTYPPLQVTNQHYITIPISGSFTFDVKCSQFFVAKKAGASAFGAFQAFVELTNCDIVDLFSSSQVTGRQVRDGQITGSGIDL
jgi:hypothetical protein